MKGLVRRFKTRGKVSEHPHCAHCKSVRREEVAEVVFSWASLLWATVYKLDKYLIIYRLKCYGKYSLQTIHVILRAEQRTLLTFTGQKFFV